MNHLRSLFALLAWSSHAQALEREPCAEVANYPDRTVRRSVPFAVGNMTDIIARSIGLQGEAGEIGRVARGCTCLLL